jgi:hypothetical protein
VGDTAILEVDHILDAHAAENPRVEGLPPGSGIERRAIEHDGSSAVTLENVGNDRGEGGEISVGVVEAEGHVKK